MKKRDLVELTIDWNRCVHVDDVIDEALFQRLAPRILLLRQESRLPITVAINSSGGSLAVVESLLNLLTGPDQDGNEGSIVTVVIQHAFSAAANLLAAGYYAVALPNSEILFHDVRYGGIEDVTPSVARIAASELQKANAEFSLRLANTIFRRLIWNYIDLSKNFDQIKERFPKTSDKYKRICEMCQSEQPSTRLDIPGFATALFANLSAKNDSLIENAMHRLGKWGGTMGLSEAIPNYKLDGSIMPGLLDGIKFLHEALRKAAKCEDGEIVWKRREADLKLFITLIADQLSEEKEGEASSFTVAIDRATENFALIESINDPKQLKMAARQLLRHKSAFFEKEAIKQLESGDEAARNAVLQSGMPTARLVWHFCVLVCGELFDGEHRMSPHEAQVLGLIDEVVGGGTIESRREFRRRREKEESTNIKSEEA